MRHKTTLIALALLCVGLTDAAVAATTKKRTSTSRSTATVAKSGSTKKTAGKGTRSRTAARQTARAVPAGPPRQNTPTPDRYMQIQQALADKGYLNSPASGVWDAASVDALRRFQKDQNLPADGKLGSLSLIALGLGPKREPLQSQLLGKPETSQQ